MRTWAAATAAAFLFLVPAFAVPFDSSDLGFSAEYPSTPTVGAPEGSEQDSAGNFVSHSVTVSSISQGEYAAMVAVDTYDSPIKLDIDGSLINERDNFLKGLKASYTSSTKGTQNGYQALFFTYDTPDHSAAGSGFIAIDVAARPRIYVVVTMRTPSASSAEISALDSFLGGFHIK